MTFKSLRVSFSCGTKTRVLPRISLTILDSVLDTAISTSRQILKAPSVLEFPSSTFLVLPKIMIKIVYGFRHVLSLVRKSDDDAIFRLTAAGAGKITLSKVSWYIPHVRPADVPKLQLYEMIEKKVNVPVGFRLRQCESISVPQTTNFTWRLTVKSSQEKPRYIIVDLSDR